LHWAIKKDHTKIASYLIQKGSDIDAVDILGRTPLSFAIENNNIKLVRTLLECGVYIWSTDVTDYKEFLKFA
jgi:ankyrin repeat protein